VLGWVAKLFARPIRPPDAGATPRPPDDDRYAPLERSEAELARTLARRFAHRLTELGADAGLADGLELAVAPDDDYGVVLRLRVPATGATYWRYEWNGSLEDALPYVATCAELTVERISRAGPPSP
jgi:hypothetical protein